MVCVSAIGVSVVERRCSYSAYIMLIALMCSSLAITMWTSSGKSGSSGAMMADHAPIDHCMDLMSMDRSGVASQLV
jgi:hypothetical protein